MQLCNFTAILYGSQDWAMSFVIWQLVCSRGKKFFPFPKHSDQPWAHPDSCSVGTRGPFGGLKWLVHASDCSHPFSAKVNNVCCYTCLATCVCDVHRDTTLCGCEPRSVTLWDDDDVRVYTGVI
jgi:hypothetical protein